VERPDTVRPAQRYEVIQALGEFLAPQSWVEIYTIFESARTNQEPPRGWDEYDDQAFRSSEIKAQLATELDDVLEGLSEFLPAKKSSPKQAEPVLSSPTTLRAGRALDGPIFVVHGHARALLHETVRVLERGTDRDVIVLHEQPNSGRTIIEKFEDHAANASFAVVLLTGDDEGGVRTSAGRHLRGRQNVIFELGFFFGKLGRQRVAVLLEDDVERPSDIDGLVYIDIDQAGAWKQTLARELEAINIPVNRSRIP
jgi:predicted nucleotide-binding protein